MSGYFYAFDDEAAAISAGAMIEGDDGAEPVGEAIVLRTGGIAVVLAEMDPDTQEITSPAVMSAPLVILSPTILPGCSTAAIVPPGHRGFA